MESPSAKEYDAADYAKGCRHITAAVNIAMLRKRMKKGGLHRCETCGKATAGGKKKSTRKHATKLVNDLDKVQLNAICIACGFVGCLHQSHTVAHLQHMTKHYCFFNMSTKEIWCVKCDGVVLDRSDRIGRAIQDVIAAYDEIVVGKSGRMLHAKGDHEPATDKPLDRPPPSSKKSKRAKDPKPSKHEANEEEDADGTIVEAAAIGLIPAGLANLGNTCYFNSTIQALKSVFAPVLANRARPSKASGGGDITRALLDFILDGKPATKNTGKRVYNPSQLLSAVREKCRQFRNRQQQDAYEVLLGLVWAIDDEFNGNSTSSHATNPEEGPSSPPMEQIFVHTDDHDTLSLMVREGSSMEEIQKLVAETLRLDQDDVFLAGPPPASSSASTQPGTTSSWHDNFVGRAMMGCLVNTVVCRTCSTTSKAFDACVSLTLSIPNNVDECALEDCLALFTASGELSQAQGCGYQCDHCSQTTPPDPSRLHTAGIQLQLHTPAPVLILHLKRLTRLKKLSRHVAFPMDLDVAPYVAQPLYGPHWPTTYTLQAVVVHSGNRFGGHYVAYVKHGAHWFFTSDTHVKVVPEATVLGAEAYMLFYINTQTFV